MLSINSMRTATVERHSLVRMGPLSVGPAFLTRKAHIIKDEQARCGQSKVISFCSIGYSWRLVKPVPYLVVNVEANKMTT